MITASDMQAIVVQLHGVRNDGNPLSRVIEAVQALQLKADEPSDKLRGLQEEHDEISRFIQQKRGETKLWHDELSGLPDDVAAFVTALIAAKSKTEDNAAALHGVLEGIRDTSRNAENLTGDLLPDYLDFHIRDLLGSVAHRASEGLKEHRSGAALRKDIRQLEAMVDRFEEGMINTGGWRYGDNRTLAERVQRLVDHYTRMAAQAVSNAQTFKDDILTWLRGMAINAESVSWAGTHREKDARLRGLVEVIERACKSVNELRLEDRTSWSGSDGNWMRSDYPVREFKRRIYDLEAEVKRLRQKAGEKSVEEVAQAIEF